MTQVVDKFGPEEKRIINSIVNDDNVAFDNAIAAIRSKESNYMAAHYIVRAMIEGDTKKRNYIYYHLVRYITSLGNSDPDWTVELYEQCGADAIEVKTYVILHGMELITGGMRKDPGNFDFAIDLFEHINDQAEDFPRMELRAIINWMKKKRQRKKLQQEQK